ncbi:hypothetical protein J28TS4_53720 [Paenibacillus lautus]|uniref:Ig-like domain-containing protein n=1 Tax=Paenibacillus lautus TaxID=1401 RepID=UPI001AFED346|nr:Ig-like domain-containing protein [Paenibacillus lautus]GIP06965.1 hypothetical protein J28TS4_53720 [Paenibacillus lautus]
MSDKSYQIKENNQVMIQGGEKKVMKKILSVALSTAMAFSMFASVAFGDDALNTQQKFDVLKEKGIFTGYPDGTAGLDKEMTRAEFAKVLVGIMGLEPIEGKASFKDKNYKADKWPAPYVEAVYAAGLMEGKNTTKMIFDFNGKITVQEMAKVLVTAQKLEIPTETNNNASDWAKGYVQAAINAGLVDAKANPKANASRSQLVDVAYSIYLAQQKPAVASYKVSENGKVVEFTLANSEVVKVTLDTALVPNKDTEVKFTHNNYDYTETVKWVVTEASKVQGVTASNLKEVVVTFDGEVDKASAELKDNYKLSDSTLSVKSAVLNDAKNTVVLTLDGDSSLKNQQKYTLTVTGVKAGTKTISATNVEFAPVDSQLPEVVSVTGLGTKAIKVVFSEPIKQTYAASFQLNGQAFYGSPSVNNREMVLRSSYDLSVGEHTLTVSGVEDFAGFKSLKSEHKFTVVEDTTAPTIAEATATLEKLTLTFSEDIDDATLKADNVYHKRGNTNVKASRYVKLTGNKYEFYFSKDNALPSYATTIYVDGVKDYSGNAMTENTKQVTAQVDTERPYVVDARVPAGQKAQLQITFSKDLAEGQKWTDLITVKDKDGKVRQVSSVSFKDSDTRNILLVNFFANLPEGTNTLEIKGIKDNTVLGNTLLDYTTTFNVGDSGEPKFAGASFKIDSEARRAVIRFNEKMDAASLVNRSNYVLTLGTNKVALPTEASLTVTQDGKGVVIDLPIEIGGVNVANNWKEIRVQGVKDVSGNYLVDFGKDIVIANYNTLSVEDSYEVNGENYTASVTGKREVKVKLSQAVSKIVDKSKVAVTANGATYGVESVVADDSDVITIKLNKDLYTSTGLNVEFAGAEFIGLAQNRIALDNVTLTQASGTVIADQVKPEVVFASGVDTYKLVGSVTGSTYKFAINFAEQLDAGLNTYIGEDLVVTRMTDNKVLTTNPAQSAHFSAEVSGQQIIVTITDATPNAEDKYEIEVKSNARYIQDLYGNVAAGKGPVRTSN